MPEEPRQDEDLQDSEAASTLNRDFAGVLRSILESASEMFPSAEETDIRFSVALVGEMGSDKFVDLVNELPIVACIALRKEIGTKAALLTDAPTASALAGFVSEGKPTREESISDDDLVSLYDALSPILDALSNACEKATGHPLGAIEGIEAVDPASPPPMLEGLSSELSERLCRATASVTIGNEDSGRLVLVLPRDLLKLAEKQVLGRRLTHLEITLHADGLGNGLLHQLLHGGASQNLQHLEDVGFPRSQVPPGEITLRIYRY